MSMFIGKEIEITAINPVEKYVGIIVHLYCDPNEMDNPEIQEKTVRYVRFGCRYLRNQGFIPANPVGWQTYIGGVIHDQPL